VVSAFVNPGGPPGRIMASLGRRTFVAAYDARLITEYRTVLVRPRLGLNPHDVERFIEEFMARGWPVEPVVWNEPMVDESDRVFVEVLKATMGFLVTGNTRHYPDEPWVISPASFWSMLSAEVGPELPR
jgi:predicted nucleic acid-binding protein